VNYELARYCFYSRSISTTGHVEKCGQLKLWSHLEMLLNDVRPDTVVYVGAAPGYNVFDHAQRRPQTTFILYDPRRIRVPPHLDNVFVRRVKFTDAEARSIRRNHPDCLFVSDIRSTTDRRSILEDQADQMRWLALIEPRYYSLKYEIGIGNELLPDTAVWCFQDCQRLQSTEVRLVGYQRPTMHLRKRPDWSAVRQRRNTWHTNQVKRKGWNSLAKKSVVRARLQALGAKLIHRKPKVSLPKDHPYLQLDLAGPNDLGVASTVLSRGQIENIVRCQNGVRPLRTLSPALPGGHPTCKYFRDNARVIAAHRLAETTPRIVALGGNALKLHALGLGIHTCSPLITEKDALKHADWKRRGIPFCTCDARKFLRKPCRACAPFSRDRESAILLVDVVYYIQKELPLLVDRFSQVVSYHHEFDGQWGELFKDERGAEAEWLRDGGHILFKPRGDGQVHRHPDHTWRKSLTAMVWSDWHEGGKLIRFIRRQSHCSVSQFDKLLAKRKRALVEEEAARKAALHASTIRTSSLVAPAVANAVKDHLDDEGLAPTLPKVRAITKSVLDKLVVDRALLAPAYNRMTQVAEVFNKLRLGKRVSAESVERAATAAEDTAKAVQPLLPKEPAPNRSWLTLCVFLAVVAGILASFAVFSVQPDFYVSEPEAGSGTAEVVPQEPSDVDVRNLAALWRIELASNPHANFSSFYDKVVPDEPAPEWLEPPTPVFPPLFICAPLIATIVAWCAVTVWTCSRPIKGLHPWR
jgi:hypothetical protein